MCGVCMYAHTGGQRFDVQCFFYHSIYPFEIRSLNSAALAGHWTLQTHPSLHPINSWERTHRYIHSLRNNWVLIGTRGWADQQRVSNHLELVTGPRGFAYPGSSCSFLCWVLGFKPNSVPLAYAYYWLSLPGPRIPCFRSLVKVWSVSLHRLFFVPPGFGRQAAVTTLEIGLHLCWWQLLGVKTHSKCLQILSEYTFT